MAQYQMAGQIDQYYNCYNITPPPPYNQPPTGSEMPTSEREQLMKNIQALTIEHINFVLYLDNYPDDQQAIEEFNTVLNQLNHATDEFESKYGPISPKSKYLQGAPWKWLESPWPWEREMGV